MMDFVMGNYEALAGIALALALLVYALITRQWSVLQAAAYRLMLSAEKLMGTAEGKEKMAAVFAGIWNLVPGWLKGFATEDKLREKLQEWYDIARDGLVGAGSGTSLE
jgi:hypothetical protein